MGEIVHIFVKQGYSYFEAEDIADHFLSEFREYIEIDGDNVSVDLKKNGDNISELLDQYGLGISNFFDILFAISSDDC